MCISSRDGLKSRKGKSTGAMQAGAVDKAAFVPTYASSKPKMAPMKVKGNSFESEAFEIDEEHTVPWIAALTTYFSYAILISVGTLRDMLDSFLGLFGVEKFSSTPVGYGKLLNDFQDFYTRRLYARIQDCFNRPICSAPGAWINVMERDFAEDHTSPMVLTGTHTTALNLSSYNYLGFAECDLEMRDEVIESMQRLGVSNTSSRSELGTTDAHKELEERVAEFVGKPAAIVFGMGFATNSTVLPTLVGAGGLILSDELNHSSIVVGARGSAARIQVFKHNCPISLEHRLRSAIAEGQPRTHRPWRKILVVVEGLYSMEGEICRLKEIVKVCKKYKAYLYVDEAHSIGALGKNGRGVLEHAGVAPEDVDIMMGTFTKSFGSVGGYIAASKEVIEFLRRSSPGSIYACSMAPAAVKQASLALRMIAGEDGTCKGREKVEHLKRNANLFRAGLKRMGCEVLGDEDSPVIPVMLYNPAKIPAFSRECIMRKLAVVVVGFPATPLIKSRVRFCISAAHTEDDLISALRVVDEVADRVMIKYKWTGRPNVAPSAQVESQSRQHCTDVVGNWDAEHFTWRDSLSIEANGRFARGNGDQGSWQVQKRDEAMILRLDWDRWPSEELQLQIHDEADTSSNTTPRRHMFKGSTHIIPEAPLRCTFILRPHPDSPKTTSPSTTRRSSATE